MVCIHMRSYNIPRVLLTIHTVFIPSIDPIPSCVANRQRAPIAIPQTELSRRQQRLDAHELAHKVINGRNTAQDGLPVAREGLAICP